ncbi:MAG: hypothetical protein BMS9Abin04_077 [Planctomycetia bacterium]|nr:MAG: hypothetical protein BMS9Abin04_077 [Planctomycetia bacterium]
MKRFPLTAGTLFLVLVARALPAEDADVTALARALSSPDRSQRLEATNRLGDLGAGAKAAVSSLARALGHRDPETRTEAARTLGILGADAGAAASALRKGLTDEDSRVRAYCAYALGRLGDVNGALVEALAQAVADPEPAVRRAAIKALRSLDVSQKRLLPLLVKTLENADPATLVPTLNTLAEGGAEAVPALCEALHDEKGCYWASLILGQMGPEAKEAVPQLISVLRRPEPEVRKEALVTLGQIGPAAAAAVPEIARILEQDEVEAVRFGAAFALGRIGVKEGAREGLKQALADENEFLSLVAAWALLQLDSEDQDLVQRATEKILTGLRSEDPHVRQAAAHAIGESKQIRDKALPGLIAALSNADEETIDQLVYAIAATGEKAAPRIARALKVKELQPIALRLVTLLGPKAKAAVPALIEALEDESNDGLFRREVAFALGAIGPDAVSATDALGGCLAADDPELRTGATYALGKIGPPAKAATKALVKLVKNGDPFEQVAGVWALVRVHPKNEKLAHVAVPVLVKALSHERRQVRAEVAAALGDLGTFARSALPQLEKALADPDPDVREAAADAIRRIGG